MTYTKIPTVTGFMVKDTTKNTRSMNIFADRITAENPGFDYVGTSTNPTSRTNPGRHLAFVEKGRKG